MRNETARQHPGGVSGGRSGPCRLARKRSIGDESSDCRSGSARWISLFRVFRVFRVFRGSPSLVCTVSLLLYLLAARGALGGDWLTHRGNPQRTGAADDQPGPKSPKVLWVHKTREHYIAAPVPGGKEVYLSSLGAFNTSRFDALAVEPASQKRITWAKSAPFLKLPVVCAPALSGGKLVFGDGMHQTDGAILHCLEAAGGLPIWQLAIPGKLVHLEGAPTIFEEKVFIGGGNAGVLCVDLNRVTLDGKEQDLAGVRKLLEAKWKVLVAAYEKEKKVDPDFALPPSEEALPRPVPKVVWQAGRDQWHVDAGVAVAAGKVVAASAYLDDEKTGERALLCLDAADGKPVWKTPLALNPWGGATLAGDLALVASSSIRFDPKKIPGASGEIVAVKIADGSVAWRKPVPGGVVSSVAVSGPLAVFTATDGSVRAYEAASGSEKWTYPGRAPFFAGVAIAGGIVYAADLAGIVHALDLAGGRKLWTLDLARDPAVMAPGSVYGSPAVQGGRLFVATCNLDATGEKAATVVVCIGDK
ncbi:MAG: PQQ-binding-like beta-propeller repeat protein [Deltaproteobacteria bacterium]